MDWCNSMFAPQSGDGATCGDQHQNDNMQADIVDLSLDDDYGSFVPPQATHTQPSAPVPSILLTTQSQQQSRQLLNHPLPGNGNRGGIESSSRPQSRSQCQSAMAELLKPSSYKAVEVDTYQYAATGSVFDENATKNDAGKKEACGFVMDRSTTPLRVPLYSSQGFSRGNVSDPTPRISAGLVLSGHDQASAIVVSASDSRNMSGSTGTTDSTRTARFDTRQCHNCTKWKYRQEWHKKQWAKNGACIKCLGAHQNAENEQRASSRSKKQALEAKIDFASKEREKQAPKANTSLAGRKNKGKVKHENQGKKQKEKRTGSSKPLFICSGSSEVAQATETALPAPKGVWAHQDAGAAAGASKNASRHVGSHRDNLQHAIRVREEESVRGSLGAIASHRESLATSITRVKRGREELTPQIFRGSNFKGSSTSALKALKGIEIPSGTGGAEVETGTEAKSTAKRAKSIASEPPLQVHINYTRAYMFICVFLTFYKDLGCKTLNLKEPAVLRCCCLISSFMETNTRRTGGIFACLALHTRSEAQPAVVFAPAIITC